MKRVTWLVIALFVLSLGTGLSTTRAAGEKDVLTVALGVEPTSLDPHRTADLMGALVQGQIYNYLFVHDKNMKLLPELAESYKLSNDKKTWTITLRKGIKFHNGDDFNAASVKFSIERILDPKTKSGRASFYEMIKSVTLIDDHTVAITTDQPFQPFISHLTYYPMAMLSPKAVAKYGNDYDHNPVGTGPFKFVEWTPGGRIVLERNENYWETKPKVGKIVFRFLREEPARTMLLETGEADFITQVSPRETQRLRANKNIDMVTVDSHFTAYLVLVNDQDEPFNNLAVRKALNYAINKDAIINSVLLGAARPYDSPLSPIGWGYKKTGSYEYNPEKAKKLLADAGYKGKKLKIELWTSVGRFTLDTEIAEVIQDQLKEVGIEADLQRKADWGAYLFGLSKGKNRMGMTQSGPVTGDADQGLYMVYHSKGPTNRMKYYNKEVDSLLEKARETSDPKVRLDAYVKAQQIIFDDAPVVWLYYPKTIYGQSKKVKDIIYLPKEQVLFKNCYKE